MSIEHLQTYLVYPNKGSDEPRAVSGANVPLSGPVFDLLNDVYNKSDRECSIDIAFNQPEAGATENPCRSLLLAYARRPDVETGLPLAVRLGENSTNRSSLGLLFLVSGSVGGERKIVIARFAANSGILADEGGSALNVEFIERVFLRSVGAYKAVLYKGVVNNRAFWTGRAVDRQINSGAVEVSKYWIADFLSSDFLTTSATGTRVLAVAMRNAARSDVELGVKREITAAVALGSNLNGHVTTVDDFMDRLGLSSAAKQAVGQQVKNPSARSQQFRFDVEEFERQLPYKTVELDSGAILSASASEFDDIFDQDTSSESGVVTFSATGKVVTEKLEKSSR